jgi:pyruvate dehydrogenase E1 component beta subunit
VHIPGLVVVTPATSADNHGLLRAAIRCDDPVIYLEHKALWPMKGPVNPDAEPIPLGKATLVTKGNDLTIVTWAGMRFECLKAAEALANQGIGVDLIDLRTLWPWDREMVFESVSRTGRLLIAHEAVKVGGFGAEVASEVGEELWSKLRAPIRRLGAPRTPVPFSVPLEDACRVSPEQIVAAATEMVKAKK